MISSCIHVGYNKIGHAVDQCIFDLIEYMMSQMVGLKFLSLAIYEIVNLQFLEELHTLLHFFKQKNVVHASNVALGLLFYKNMGWYRLAFYPMPLANHHELLKDYFRLFHKHNPEHAMKTITYIETFSVE